ncbi:MAG: single-stranded-DNA-specific exonuclease RecJ [Burkholderiales bacterium 70-64]|nr:MAG: single-stranded-DNA-specific exonuclease RecJ [Burkholderiales bacterium 70-64]
MITTRPVPPAALQRLLEAGVAPVLARLLAARGIADSAALSRDMGRLAPPDAMKGLALAARLLADAIERGERLCIVADYDCDGATACAVAMRGLHALGAAPGQVDYLVPNRFEHGYGLTPPVVALAARHPRLGRPDWLLTVDSGIASLEGVAAARAAGMRVIVTDHHLPAQALPQADAIVDPNQPGCGFPSKHLAGVGVMFYLLLALRAEWRRRDPGAAAARAPLQRLLDLVALGTIADLVPLDANNRLLVTAGLQRIRAGAACAGVRALLRVAGREERRAGSADLGFALGPRINAAGRLADISVGIECLLSDDEARAAELAGALDAINRERRDLERDMREEALAALEALPEPAAARCSVVLHREGWHEGLIGLIAGRIKDRLHRPTFALATAAGDAAQLRGSGRSIPGVHLRDVLDLVDKRAPGLLLRFGGHAMAAGLTLHAARLAEFEARLEEAVAAFADPSCFAPTLMTDGALAPGEIDLALVDALEAEVWGQGFAPPLFSGEFTVLRQSVLAGRHLKVELRAGTAAAGGAANGAAPIAAAGATAAAAQRLGAIAFGRTEPLPSPARLAYRLMRDEWQGLASVRLVIEAAEAASPV